MAINPTADIIFLDGQLQAEINLATDVGIKLGVATAGPLLRPTLTSQTSSVLQFRQGPLVASGAHHVTFSGPVYLLRTNASVLGTVGAVTKIPASTSPSSLASMATSLTTYTLHAQVDSATAASLALTTAALAGGWTAPSASLQLTITSGAGTVAHTQTITYVDTNGDVQTSSPVAIAGPGTVTTSFSTGVASIISVVPSAAPVGTQDYTAAFTTPADRYYARIKTINGGVLGVTGGTTPNVQVSLDDGLTYSRTLSVPTSGVMELLTYAGGLTPQATGVTLTFSPATTSQQVYGSLRVPGATVPGDVVYTKRVSAAVTVQHVVNPTPTAFSVGVVGSAITVTAATSGGTKSSLTFAGNLDSLFEVQTVGTGGDAITISTVNDGGTGNVTGAGTNSLVIHYTTGVTTVANVEASFPVAAAFGSVTATGGTGANVLVNPGDTHAATNLTGGADAAVTTTGNDVVAGIEASVPASALVTAVAVGAGSGLIASSAALGFADSGVDYTPRQEGVQVRHGDPGPSHAILSVSTVGKQVTVYPVTDANGIQTSTAAQVAAAVAADALAGPLLLAVATGAGTGIVGMQGVFTALPVSVATGDQFTFATTPPKWGPADLAEALEVLRKNDAALDAFSVMHVLGDAADSDVQTTQGWLDTLGSQKRKFKAAYHEAPFMGSTSESTWTAGLLSNFTHITAVPKVGLGAGEANVSNPANGTIDRRNVVTPYFARLMICPISELPSHVDCETDLGIQNALSGTFTRPSTGATVNPLWQTEDSLVTLNGYNYVTLRTLPGRTGIYVRQGLMFTVEGGDYLFVTNRRTADVVAAVAYDEIIRNLNANLLVDPRTGQLAEVELKRIESQVEGRVRREVMGGARQHVSGVQCLLDRGTNFQTTGEITGNLRVVGRTPATSITLKLGYVRTLSG